MLRGKLPGGHSIGDRYDRLGNVEPEGTAAYTKKGINTFYCPRPVIEIGKSLQKEERYMGKDEKGAGPTRNIG